jgi:hypothetical protein
MMKKMVGMNTRKLGVLHEAEKFNEFKLSD